MASFENGVDLPGLGALFGGRVPRGTTVVVLYDAESDWRFLARTLVSGIAQQGIDTLMVVTSEPVEKTRVWLRDRGVPIDTMEKDERLILSDGFSHKAGLSSPEKVHFSSFDPSEVAIAARDAEDAWKPWGAPYLFECMSEVAASADERTFLKFYRNWTARLCASGFVCIEGFVRDMHSESFYNAISDIATAVVEVRRVEFSGAFEDVVRVRAFKGHRPDTRRHLVRTDDALGMTLTPLDA